MSAAADLIEFLRARLDEDEAAALAATAGPWEWIPDGRDGDVMLVAPSVQHTYETSYGLGSSPEQVIGAIGTNSEGWVCVGDQDAAHIARWDPARVLAEVAAKRRIVEMAERTDRESDDHPGWEGAVLHLIQIYADYPDFDRAWLIAKETP